MTLKQHWILALLLFFGVASILSAYPRLSQTADENFHVMCGLQWWEKGTYKIHRANPPLPRVAAASLIHLVPPRDIIKGKVNDYKRFHLRTTFMRMGILPFFVFSCFLVFSWSRRIYDTNIALWSLASYVTLPPVLAHAGFATTDMVYATMFIWAMIAAIAWLDKPSRKNALWAGASFALMVCSKFSGLMQWHVGMLFIILCQALTYDMGTERKKLFRKEHLTSLFIYILPVVILVIGIMYRFAYQDFFIGLVEAKEFNERGFAIWLFGPLYNKAVWYFFPVIFFFKTPIAFHIATLFGNARIIRDLKQEGGIMHARRLYPLLAMLGVMLPSLISNVNMGVRHVLPVYPLLAVPVGYGLYCMWHHKALAMRGFAVLLCLWQLVACLRSYPEYIAYYNEFAGSHPEHIAIDSDFDWGQNIRLLQEEIEKRDIKELHICVRRLVASARTMSSTLTTMDLLCPTKPANGWFAVARNYRELFPERTKWLDDYKPVSTIGSTMDLYYIWENDKRISK